MLEGQQGHAGMSLDRRSGVDVWSDRSRSPRRPCPCPAFEEGSRWSWNRGRDNVLVEDWRRARSAMAP